MGGGVPKSGSPTVRRITSSPRPAAPDRLVVDVPGLGGGAAQARCTLRHSARAQLRRGAGGQTLTPRPKRRSSRACTSSNTADSSPVDDGRRDQHLHVLELGPAIGAGEVHQLPDAHHRDQRAVLQHGDELVAGRRDDQAHRLRQDDEAHGLAGREAERACAVPLAARDAPGCRRGRSRPCRRRSTATGR